MHEHNFFGVELIDRFMDVPILSLDQFAIGVGLIVPRKEKAVLSKDKKDIVVVGVMADWRFLEKVTWIQVETRFY